MTSWNGGTGAGRGAPRPGPGTRLSPDRAAQIQRRATAVVAGSFLATFLSGVGLFVLYWLGGQTQLEAVLVAIAVGGIGVGLVVWSHWLMPADDLIEERHPIQSDPEAREQVVSALGEVGRRRFLLLLICGAFAGLGAALVLPLLSLGPAPGRSLFETSWKKGSRLVDAQGNVVHAADLPPEGIVTVFPDNAPLAADSQAILLHVDPSQLQLAGDAATWAPNGFICYSKLCTHAGCPVGLFRAETGDLVCPCHQSTFAAYRGAIPTAGPAVRPLPQLPLQLNADGTFSALGDFPEPVGPSFWDLGS